MAYQTRFGSLREYQKGGVEAIKDDPRNYAFANIFEVAGKAQKWERVAVGRNLKYVVEVVKAEGTSPWYASAHDETALVMDGEVEIRLVKPDVQIVADRDSPESSTYVTGCIAHLPSDGKGPGRSFESCEVKPAREPAHVTSRETLPGKSPR